MKIQGYEINKDGFIVDVLAIRVDKNGDPVEKLPNSTIIAAKQDGLCRARWTGTEWIEDMTQEAMEELNNVLIEPTIEERLKQAEDTILFLLMGGM